MTLKDQLKRDVTDDLPTWTYRGAVILLAGILFSLVMWNGGRILKGVEDTQRSTDGIERNLISINQKIEDHERRLSKVEDRFDSGGWSRNNYIDSRREPTPMP